MAWQPPDPPDPPATIGHGATGSWQPPDPPDAPESPSMLERGADVALAVAFPHASIVRAMGHQAERAGEQLMSLPGDAADALSHALRTSGTHYRTLAHGVGLPVDAPSEPAADEYRQAVIEALAMTGGGALGGKLAGKAKEGLQYLGRGFRTHGGAERFIAEKAPFVVEGAGGSAHAGLRDLLGPAITGAVVNYGVDAYGPTPWELTDKPVAGTAGLVAGAGLAKNTIDDLLLQNPRWRELVMRQGSSSPVATAIGAALGYIAAQGVQLGAEGVDAVVQRFTGEAAMPPAGPGEAMMGPIGGPAVPVDPNVLAQQLMGAR